MVIGDGSPGYVEICLDNNNIPSGGGTSCNPGGACNPPYGGGGWAARIVIYNSDGTTYTGAALSTFIATTANGTCFTVPTPNGYAYIFGLCLTAGTTISWSTLNFCGDEVCTGTAPPCAGPPCGSCATACGTCGFATAPTVNDVTTQCDDYAYTPALAGGETSTRCHQFTALETSVDFGVIVSSTCTGGNVTNFSWALEESTCSGIIQTGTLSSLTLTSLTVGTTYTFCYTFTVPAGCTHSTHYPYFVGAQTVVLPVELGFFQASKEDGYNYITWMTHTELNNDYFTLEHSSDGLMWEVIQNVNGAGTTSLEQNYSSTHRDFENSLNYYRLSQTDFDGTKKVLGIKSVDNRDGLKIITKVNTLGQEVDEFYNGVVIYYYSDGSTKKTIQH